MSKAVNDWLARRTHKCNVANWTFMNEEWEGLTTTDTPFFLLNSHLYLVRISYGVSLFNFFYRSTFNPLIFSYFLIKTQNYQISFSLMMWFEQWMCTYIIYFRPQNFWQQLFLEEDSPRLTLMFACDWVHTEALFS